MKKFFAVFAACALLASCATKPATEEQTEEEAVAVEEVVAEAPAEEAAEVAPAADNEKATLIDLYVKACEEQNEVEATRVAKRIDAEYKDQLTSADIERMTNASAVLAGQRAEQVKEAAPVVKEEAEKAAEALKSLKK